MPACATALLALLCAATANAGSVTVNVETSDSGAVSNGVRWILEEDTTYEIDPSAPTPADPFDRASFKLHKSYMPIAASGEAPGTSFTIDGVDESKRYYLTVVPNRPDGVDCEAGQGCYTMSGAPVRFGGATDIAVRVVIAPQPLPASQARVLVFDDTGLINNAPDATEAGLGDFVIFIYDAGGGQMVTDLFGNPLGTKYDPLTGDVLDLGDGTIHTMNEDEVNDPVRNPLGLRVGEALIQNIAPAKYGIQVVPPAGQGWHQTTTIEGTKGIDVWLRAGEPMFAIEFGPTFAHAFFGFVQEFDELGGAGSTVTGTVTNLRMGRPADPNFYSGQELGNCWIGLNDLTNSSGRYVAPCNKYGEGEASFEIRNVPDGTYQLVVWDDYLLNIISFFTVIVDGADVNLAADATAVPRWFADHEHFVFEDKNGNGVRDIFDGELEPGVPEQAINLRYRDGSIYFASATDLDGYLPIEEVFPFFSWLVAESDFARFRATSARITVDDGGPIPVTGDPDDPTDPANGLRNPQIQNASGALQRIETTIPGACAGIAATEAECEQVGAPPLLEGYNSFAGTNHKFEWGRERYHAGQNGGISGVVYYQTTRAENNPQYAAAEPWEPGVPRVQINIYRADPSGVIQDYDGNGSIELADIDNYPFDWSEGLSATPGPEDVDRTGGTGFDLGDAIEYAHTDSWDDSIPEGCLGDTLQAGTPHEGDCYDGLRNWSQVRPAVFDGGFGIGAPWDGTENYLAPGPYVVEAAAPPGYEHQDELSKNVDFGDTFIPQALPPICVGDPDHAGPQQSWNYVPPGSELELFGGVEVDSRYTGNRPFCNMKLIEVKDARNAATDFFLYTEAPIAGHIQGNVTNDIGNETNPNSLNFGEKLSGANLPISIRDHLGNEVNRLYTDENGRYNGLVPSTYRINVPMPTGVSPNMLQICLNPPTMEDPSNPGTQIPDPYHDPRYSQTCYTLNFNPGTTTYLDTPVLPVAAFVGTPDWQLDCNYPNGTPVISIVDSDTSVGGPIADTDGSTTLTITSAGLVQVANPALPRPALVTRNFRFEDGAQVFLNGVELTGVTWSDNGDGTDSLTVNVPAGASTGQLEVVGGVSGRRSVHGITVIVMDDPSAAHVVASTALGAIQAAIDAAAPGDVVLVPPGTYYESVIMTKPIQLQGFGAGATVINAGRGAFFDNLINWRAEANRRVNCPATPADQIGLLPGQGNNLPGGTNPADCGFVPGTGLLVAEEAAGIFVAPTFDGAGAFGGATARIDGFTFTSADYSGGIVVNGNATGLEISNNIVRNNQGVSAGGIRIGQSTLYDANGVLVDAGNDDVSIHHNYISQNSSTFDHGGGVGLYNGADNYDVWSNYVCGNFTQGDGAGIAHFGRSPGGTIRNNQILFNQSYDQTAQNTGGTAGGILVAGHQQQAAAPIQLTAGTGPVRIIGNNIQGNQAGSGDGGGIMLRSVNGQDLLVTVPENRESVHILNNMITNNVAAFAGGGIVLQDAVNVSIIHNTIANNDSTATVAAVLNAGLNQSTGQPAGVVSRSHSTDLLALGAPGIGDFSIPVFNNNIVIGNRSMHWEAGTGLLVDRFWDLGALGTGTVSGFAPSGNILTQEDPGNAAFSGANTLASAANEDIGLVTPYVNGVSGTASPFSFADFATPLLAAGALDEGGNFLTVVYGPLTPSGDYHAEAVMAVVDAAPIANMLGLADLFSDIDGDPRPVWTLSALLPDIGADELPAVDPGVAVAPRIISMPSLSVQNGLPYSYQVIAVDPNPGSVLSYSVQRCNNSYSNCGLSLLGASINATGLFTWTPPNTAARNFRITVCDGTALCDQQDFRLNPYNSNPPIARHDPAANGNGFLEVNVLGQFVWPAPGVLANDSTGNGNRPETLTPTIQDTSALPAGSAVRLGTNGAVIFTAPDAWLGETSFTYTVSDGVDPSPSAPATVSLRRRITITNATFTDSPGTANDSWNISGASGNFGGNPSGNIRIFVDLVPAAGGEGGGPINLGSTLVTRGGDTWNIAVTGVSMGAGDTLTVRLNNGNVLLQGVMPAILYDGAGANTFTTVFVQCEGDDDGDGIYSPAEQAAHPDIWCKHLGAGDGFIQMADGKEIYTFGFNDLSNTLPVDAVGKGLLNAQFPAPSLVFNEGQEAWLTLTNVGTILRPDLFDPHTVHFHGFPNASSVFDGVPESSISINGGFSLTYYYKIVDPGTFMYHCHVEAAEHMQMGMLGNLYVRPAQDGASFDDPTDGVAKSYSSFVYNDGDGSTGYDVEKAIQIGSMDSNFHDEHLAVQPLPFAEMHDDYPMLNGRGYPDTVSMTDVPASPSKADSGVDSALESSQKVNTLINATQGDRILLRISNLNVTQFSTLATSGLTMKVVGTGAHVLRGPGGDNLYYETNSVTLGGGEAVDVLIETAGVAPGTYVLYTTNLNDLSNGTEDFGGMMAEIVISAP